MRCGCGRWRNGSGAAERETDLGRLPAARGISANLVAAYHHNHIFVPWARRGEALKMLANLAKGHTKVRPRT
jgi:hypothetical protein